MCFNKITFYQFKKHLIVFGGFHDNPLRGESKYFNDVHAFDIQEMKWKKLEISGVKPPSPRSGSNMFATSDGRIVIYGGYCKEKIKSKVASGKKSNVGDSSKEVGKTLDDMFLLVPDKHDDTLSKWRWHNVKQTGNRPNPRSGIASTPLPNSNKAYFFGGVNDEVNSNDSDDDDDMRQGNFYSDLYLCTIDNEKATWQKIELSGIKEDTLDKKKRRGNAKDASSGPCENAGENDICDEDKTGEEGAIDEETTSRIQGLELDGDKTKVIGDGIDESKSSVRVVEDGAFTISSTIIHSNSEITKEQSSTVDSDMKSKGIY